MSQLPAPRLLSTTDVADIIARYASIIAADEALLPTFDQPRGDGRPCIQIDTRYHYVISERGTEFERRSTSALGELLYWVFDSVTFSLASDHELANRRSEVVSRRLLFATQIALMRALDPAWGARLEVRVAAVRKTHPFDDRNH